MSNEDQNPAENANGDEDILDGEAAFAMEEDAFFESMRKYLRTAGKLKMLMAMMM